VKDQDKCSADSANADKDCDKLKKESTDKEDVIYKERDQCYTDRAKCEKEGID
jgi:hypothetical protein